MRALSSRAWFWIAQIGGWGAYASSLFLTFLPSMEPGRRLAVFINKELRAVVGIVLSLGLLWLYRRVVPEPEVSGRVAVVAVNMSTDPRDVTLDLSNGCVDRLTRFSTSATEDVGDDGVVELSNGRAPVTLAGQSVTTFVSR